MRIWCAVPAGVVARYGRERVSFLHAPAVFTCFVLEQRVPCHIGHDWCCCSRIVRTYLHGAPLGHERVTFLVLLFVMHTSETGLLPKTTCCYTTLAHVIKSAYRIDSLPPGVLSNKIYKSAASGKSQYISQMFVSALCKLKSLMTHFEENDVEGLKNEEQPHSTDWSFWIARAFKHKTALFYSGLFGWAQRVWADLKNNEVDVVFYRLNNEVACFREPPSLSSLVKEPIPHPLLFDGELMHKQHFHGEPSHWVRISLLYLYV